MAKSPLRPFADLYDYVLSKNVVVVLDIETTGLSREKHAEIIEIGAVKVDISKRKIIDTFSEFVKPSEAFNIPPKITELTTITWDQVKDSPYKEEVLPKLYDFIEDLPVVAHNAQFDWFRFLLPEFESVGLHAGNEVICTYMLSRALYPQRDRNEYNLKSMCEMFGARIVGHHRAYVDCKWTASLFLRLLDEYERQYGALVRRQAPKQITASYTARNVRFGDMRINRVSYYAGSDSKHGPRIYVYTNFGILRYSSRRKVWTVDSLWTKENAPAQEWGAQVSKMLAADPDTLIERYAESA